jgi:hypothetical protein
MGNVIQFRPRVASAKTIAKLVELGYLPPAKRHKSSAIENAIRRLRQNLYRDGVISDADLLRNQPTGVNANPSAPTAPGSATDAT